MSTGLYHLCAVLAVLVFIVLAGTRWKWHPFFALLAAAVMLGVVAGLPIASLPGWLQDGFAAMVKKVGLVIILGTLTGHVLEKSGALTLIAHRMMRLFGARHSAVAITVVGAVVGIPIFCDSGFIILNGLIAPLAGSNKRRALSLSTGLAGGLYVTHCLLPPHPGATAGAATMGLKDHLGLVMAIGLGIAVVLTIIAALFAHRLGKNVSSEDTVVLQECPVQMPLYKAILPIALPLVLIGLGSFSSVWQPGSTIHTLISFAGHPVMALLLGFATSLLTIDKSVPKTTIQKWFPQAMMHAGSILIIVGAGGMLGQVIQNTEITALVGSWVSTKAMQPWMFILLTWTVSVVLKTAQGSTTSAIIVVSAMMAPLLPAAGMLSPLAATLVLMSICTGTMMVSHANDAYFWVITEFAGQPMRDTYRSFTVLSVLLSVAGLGVLLAMAGLLL